MSIYLVLGLVGTAVLLLSLVLGDLLDGVFDGLAGDWFSTEIVGSFFAALGFGGFIAQQAGAPDSVALIAGLGAGVVFGGLGAWLTRLVRGGSTDHTPSSDDLIGHEGTVVSAVPDDGFGSVRIYLGGHTITMNARAETALEAGTRVHVTGVVSPTALRVAPVWNSLPSTDV
ncbi:NfeD family protein [Nocardioides sp. GXZ039]|uniref:NfeD family protein n=1 Tax=Nocardioides sp. GXZ039 TaxID=3136018 RepID=UPI0030F443E5